MLANRLRMATAATAATAAPNASTLTQLAALYNTESATGYLLSSGDIALRITTKIFYSSIEGMATPPANTTVQSPDAAYNTNAAVTSSYGIRLWLERVTSSKTEDLLYASQTFSGTPTALSSCFITSTLSKITTENPITSITQQAFDSAGSSSGGGSGNINVSWDGSSCGFLIACMRSASGTPTLSSSDVTLGSYKYLGGDTSAWRIYYFVDLSSVSARSIQIAYTASANYVCEALVFGCA